MFPFPSSLLMGQASGGSSLTTYRYFKINIDSVQSSTSAAIAEWQLASSSGGPNLIQFTTATASSSNGPFVPSEAVDGVVSSGNAWASLTGFPQWIKIDMGAGNAITPAEMNIVSTIGGSNGQAPKDFQLLGSNDDSTYIQIAGWVGFAGWSAPPAFTTFTISQASPVFSVSPTITTDTGFYGTGDTATVAYTHNGSITAIQWTRDGAAISGATSTSYTYVSGDVGTTVACAVTATNGFGSTSATATGHAIVTPTSATVHLLLAGDMQSGTDTLLTAGDMQSGTDHITITTRTA